ncbi:MAG: DJ-1/PfpI family protein [Alphaproteobacteria bacterium]|nr:DJ-1/PfpI family protein [Alphaproteobacteria bacterium]MBV8548466.1 DJ-1/PfpI family protein [Alphaproteobacteria bacterium]
MNNTLAGKNIAILVANGFDENQMTEIQRALLKEKANIKTIAPEQGVVNGWQGNGWGHYFPVDGQIGETLGSDFDMLVLPGGERATAKLKGNLHTRRIINHFMEANKPIAAIGAGTGLIALTGKLSGVVMTGSADVQDELKAAEAVIGQDPIEICDNLLTAEGSDIVAWVEQTIAFFSETAAEVSAAA